MVHLGDLVLGPEVTEAPAGGCRANRNVIIRVFAREIFHEIFQYFSSFFNISNHLTL